MSDLLDLVDIPSASTLTMGSVGTIVSIVDTVILIVAFIVGCALYAAFDTSHLEPQQNKGMRAFFNFDRLVISSILRLLYAVCAALIFGLGIVAAVNNTVVTGGIEGLAEGLVSGVYIIVMYELVLRLAFELIVLIIQIAQNTAALRNGLLDDSERRSAIHINTGAAQQQPASMGAAWHAPQQSAGSATPASAATPSTVRVAEGAWDCPTCGAHNDGGSFCRACGGRRS